MDAYRAHCMEPVVRAYAKMAPAIAAYRETLDADLRMCERDVDQWLSVLLPVVSAATRGAFCMHACLSAHACVAGFRQRLRQAADRLEIQNIRQQIAATTSCTAVVSADLARAVQHHRELKAQHSLFQQQLREEDELSAQVSCGPQRSLRFYFPISCLSHLFLICHDVRCLLVKMSSRSG